MKTYTATIALLLEVGADNFEDAETVVKGAVSVSEVTEEERAKYSWRDGTVKLLGKKTFINLEEVKEDLPGQTEDPTIDE